MKKRPEHDRSCCSMERKNLVREIRKCDLCSESYEEFHRCYREAAKESGRRAKACIIS